MFYWLQIFASVKSRSLAIVASTLESLLDLLAGVILLFTRWAMKRENVYKYPIGKLRVQPVGIVVFAAIMATLGNGSSFAHLHICEKYVRLLPRSETKCPNWAFDFVFQ